MAFTREQRLADDLDDELGVSLRRIVSVPTWTRQKHELYDQMEALARQSGYRAFTGDCRDYFLDIKGHSGLYDVPLNQRGALKVFAGTRARLICAGAWDQFSGRYYLVGDVTSGRKAP